MLVTLQPWIDTGSVGTMALAYIGEAMAAQPLGQLTRPGRFFDFTRYRPMISREGGERRVTVPNTRLHYALAGHDSPDFVFLHALEPHNNGDEFVDVLTEVAPPRDIRENRTVRPRYPPGPHTPPPMPR